MGLNVTPIDDPITEVGPSSDERYIADLEAEIVQLTSDKRELQQQVTQLRIELAQAKIVSADLDYKIKYHQLLKSFHTTLEEFLPFG